MIHPQFDHLKGPERAQAWRAMTPAEQEAWRAARVGPAGVVKITSKHRFCTQCEDFVIPVHRGSGIIEIGAWVFLCFLGSLYSIWRYSDKPKCPKCGGITVPVDSTAAMRVAKASARMPVVTG